MAILDDKETLEREDSLDLLQLRKAMDKVSFKCRSITSFIGTIPAIVHTTQPP
jgi:hypothetical protein